MQDIGTLGGTYCIAAAINEVGQVTGHSTITGSSARHAFRYSDGSMDDLGTLGGTTSWGWDINEFGDIVGSARTASGAEHAFLYVGTPGEDGNMIDLHAWVHDEHASDAAGWTLLRAFGINDTGWIVGDGVYNGRTRAFLLDVRELLPIDYWPLGDLNCNGVVNVADIAAFVLALTDPAGYSTTYPGCHVELADINQSQEVNVADIGLFVELLTG